jgi:hypothetical protein
VILLNTEFPQTLSKNSLASVRKRTIPTERPPLLNEVSANILRIEGDTWPALRIPRSYSRISRQKPLLFLPSCSSVVLTRLSGPCSRPTTCFPLVVPGNRTRDLRICTHELLPLDHRENRVHSNCNFKLYEILRNKFLFRSFNKGTFPQKTALGVLRTCVFPLLTGKASRFNKPQRNLPQFRILKENQKWCLSDILLSAV